MMKTIAFYCVFLLVFLFQFLFPELVLAQSPANDDICNAQQLIIGAAAIIGDNTNATAEPGEPVGSCYLESIVDVSIWYFIVPTVTGNYEVTTDLNILNNNDTQLGAYSSSAGCSGLLTEIACNEDVSSTNYLSTMTIQGAFAGDTVWIQVDGWGANGGLTGTFEIQVTSLPVLPFDASINNTSIVATGLAGYNLVPPSQNSPPVFKVNVENNGQNAVTSVNLSGNINPGNSLVSVMQSSIPAFSTNNLETTSFPTISPNTAYSAIFDVSIAENDGDLSNNADTLSFTSGVLSDTIFALENTSGLGMGYGSTVAARLGNRFEFTSPDTITSITMAFVNPTIPDFIIFIDGFDPVNNSVTNNLWTSGIIPIPGNGFHTYSVNLPVSPGSYLISVLQFANNSIRLGLTGSVHRNNTSYFGSPNGLSLSPLEDLNRFSTLIIRANLNTDFNRSGSLSAFDLLSPNSGARIESDLVNPTTPVQISWNSSRTANPSPVTYEWMLDVQGGNFSNPIYSTLSDNNGMDTILSLTTGGIDTILADLGIQFGDSIQTIWTIRASQGIGSREANNGPFDINLVRGAVTGIPNNLFDSSIKMYPNPTKGLFSLEMEMDLIQGYSIEIFDLNEFLQFKKKLNSDGNTIDIRSLPSGIYFYNINGGDGVKRGKIIKE